MSPIPNEILGLLVDPETRAPLRQASETDMAALRRAIEAGTAHRRDGRAVADELDGALITEDGRGAYPIVSGLPHLLVDAKLVIESPLGES